MSIRKLFFVTFLEKKVTKNSWPRELIPSRSSTSLEQPSADKEFIFYPSGLQSKRFRKPFNRSCRRLKDFPYLAGSCSSEAFWRNEFLQPEFLVTFFDKKVTRKLFETSYKYWLTTMFLIF